MGDVVWLVWESPSGITPVEWLVGVFSDEKKAREHIEREKSYTGDTYEFRVAPWGVE